MGLKNTLICVRKGSGNTGTGSCVVDIDRIVAAMTIPAGTEIPVGTTLSAVKTAISAGIIANDPLLRYYPIPNLVPQADNSGDIQVQTYPDGRVVVTGEGNYDWTFDLLEGQNCLSSRLRKHNGGNEKVLLVTKNGLLLGQNGATDDVMVGFDPSILFALAPVVSQGQDAVTAYRWRLSFEKRQLADNLAFVDFGSDPYMLTIRGLQDVSLNKISRVTTALKIGATTACGSVNLYDLYKSALNTATAWLVTTSTGAVQTLSSVATDDNVKGWTLTLDTTDPDYVANATVYVSWVGPTDLAALSTPVKPYESNVIPVSV